MRACNVYLIYYHLKRKIKSLTCHETTFFSYICKNQTWIKRCLYQSRRPNESTLVPKRLFRVSNIVKGNQMKNKIFLDVLFKSDAFLDGKQEIYMALRKG